MKKITPRTYSVPALDKGLDILELLSQAPGPLTIVDLATQLNRTRNEIFRMLDGLQRRTSVRRAILSRVVPCLRVVRVTAD